MTISSDNLATLEARNEIFVNGSRTFPRMLDQSVANMTDSGKSARCTFFQSALVAAGENYHTHTQAQRYYRVINFFLRSQCYSRWTCAYLTIFLHFWWPYWCSARWTDRLCLAIVRHIALLATIFRWIITVNGDIVYIGLLYVGSAARYTYCAVNYVSNDSRHRRRPSCNKSKLILLSVEYLLQFRPSAKWRDEIKEMSNNFERIFSRGLLLKRLKIIFF